MPKFIKRKTGVRGVVGGRKFVVRSRQVGTPKRANAVRSTTSVIRKKADSTLDSLNMLLERDENAKVAEAHRDQDENAIYVEEPKAFDGLSNADEARELYDQALAYERKKSGSVEDHIKIIELENEKEKRALEAEIRELKRELHRTAPLHDTKFFSLSNELKSALADLEKVAEMPRHLVGQTAVLERPVPLSGQPLTPSIAPQPVQKTVVKPPETRPTAAETPKTDQPEEKKVLAQKKVLVTGVSAVLVIFAISGLAGVFFSQPKVDEKLVAEYLPQAGQVQGVQTQQADQSGAAAADPSQADVSFEQSVWDDYKDAAFGIMLQYPKNAVKVIRTDSNVTFIRKTGYLFKVQRIETSFTVDEYWKQIKSTSLNYVATSEKFKGKVALKLELEDMTDYPGDRYLVKEGGFIYDVWYATPSNNFATDDIKLAEKMLASLSIVEPVEF